MDESKIVFSSSYSESDFKIMQLEPDVVDSMQQGESQGKDYRIKFYRVIIKGEGTEQCVLATQSKSYCIEKIDTSNTVLLCQQLNREEYKVFGGCGSILEVTDIYLSHHVVSK